MGNLVFGSGAEPGRASKARGGLTESPMGRDYDATESDRERHNGEESMNQLTEESCRRETGGDVSDDTVQSLVGHRVIVAVDVVAFARVFDEHHHRFSLRLTGGPLCTRTTGVLYSSLFTISTVIKTTSVCDGDARSVGGGRGWVAGDTDGLAGHSGRGQPARSKRSAVQVRVVTGISAASTGGVLVLVELHGTTA